MTQPSITPDRLAKALDGRVLGLKYLSLDCFDTLIWRNMHAPVNLFGDLFDDTAGAYHRIWGEGMARERAAMRHRREEVTIAEIYECLMPEGDEGTRAAAIEAELAAEGRHAFAFLPTVELMREAKRLGLGVVIVSDTYLGTDQLTALIRAAGGDEVVGLIDKIFCSSDFGVTKTSGIFPHVLKALGVRPEEMLHIGDNKAADYDAPTALGIQALHLDQFDDDTAQRLRLEAAVSAIIEPVGQVQTPTFQPHRAQIAMARTMEPVSRFGYATLGPVLYGFARWLKDEAARLRQETGGGEVRFVFLLRDGHLPQRVYEAIADADGPPVSAIELSRFTASAASMTRKEQILRYLEGEVGTTRPAVIARQLLHTPDEVARIVHDARGGKMGFVEKMTSSKSIERITTRSRAFAERLFKYVGKQTGAQPGDTIALIDLGYNGTVQNQIGAAMAKALSVKVCGLYLLLRPQERTSQVKRGFIGPDNYDFMTLSGLTTNVSVLEQLCTIAQGSVVDYTVAGEAVRAKAGYKGGQSAVRETIAEACVDYARTYGSAFVKPPASDDAVSQRRSAAAALARLMFLPTPEEIEVLKDFEHDVNLGTDDMLKLFDCERAEKGLRHSGLFYLKNADRMYLPAEIRDQGLPLSLALLTQRRFGLQLRYSDFQHKPLMIPVMVAGGGAVELTEIQAYATHDGYYRATAPIGDSRFAIGVQFGKLYDFVQVDEVSFSPLEDIESKLGQPNANALDAQRLFEGMTEAATGLFHCADENAFMMVPPPPRKDDRAMVLNVVFRPIAKRADAASAVQATAA